MPVLALLPPTTGGHGSAWETEGFGDCGDHFCKIHRPRNRVTTPSGSGRRLRLGSTGELGALHTRYLGLSPASLVWKSLSRYPAEHLSCWGRLRSLRSPCRPVCPYIPEATANGLMESLWIATLTTPARASRKKECSWVTRPEVLFIAPQMSTVPRLSIPRLHKRAVSWVNHYWLLSATPCPGPELALNLACPLL